MRQEFSKFKDRWQVRVRCIKPDDVLPVEGDVVDVMKCGGEVIQIKLGKFAYRQPVGGNVFFEIDG